MFSLVFFSFQNRHPFIFAVPGMFVNLIVSRKLTDGLVYWGKTKTKQHRKQTS